MTLFLPLDATIPLPSSPPFLVASHDPASHVKGVVKAILKARRIVVVCGAGISVEAGIPDFRSSEGLFQSLKKDHLGVVSGQDLFDASIFNSPDMISLFCQMIARLSKLSEAAEPTRFHRLLSLLDDRRCLLRVYTQNIDALEEKSGLTLGIPDADTKRSYRGSRTKKAPAPTVEAPADIAQPREPSTTRTTFPPAKIPSCIPLHGTLQLMHCIACTQSYPLRDHIESLLSGTLPPCPQCTALEQTRQVLGKRSHSIGKLRPSVMLYNEGHKDGEAIGDVVWKDLAGSLQGTGRSGADLILVVGTSLRVLGTKRIVQEFSKALRSQDVTMNALLDPPTDKTMPTHSSHRSTTGSDCAPAVRTIYLNLEFPGSTKSWEGVFDVWIRGDAQQFADMVNEELSKEEGVKGLAKERKRKRDEEI